MPIWGKANAVCLKEEVCESDSGGCGTHGLRQKALRGGVVFAISPTLFPLSDFCFLGSSHKEHL